MSCGPSGPHAQRAPTRSGGSAKPTQAKPAARVEQQTGRGGPTPAGGDLHDREASRIRVKQVGKVSPSSPCTWFPVHGGGLASSHTQEHSFPRKRIKARPDGRHHDWLSGRPGVCLCGAWAE